MHTTSNHAATRAINARRSTHDARVGGFLIRSCALTLGLLLLGALPASAQDLTGSYLYQPPEGTVRLELQQAGDRLTGVLYGLDGTQNPLEGTFADGRATGTLRMTSGDGWFAVAAHGDGVRLLAGAFDPDTGEPDLTDGWQLDFTRSSATVAASVASGAGAMSASGDVARQNASPSAPAITPLVQEWMNHLGGRKVTYIDSYNDGSGGGFSDRWEAYICSDGSFHFRSSSSMSADVGGVFGNSSGSDSFSGRWRIIEHSGQAVLQYQQEHEVGTEQGQWVALGYQNGATYFDGTRVYVTDDNNMCR